MEETRMDELIHSIVDRVLARLERDMPKDEDVQGTLAIVTSYVPSPKRAGKALVEQYGEDVECALCGEADFEPYGFQTLRVYDALAQKQLVQKAAEKGRIVLVTPKISLMERIAQGDDNGLIEHIMLRALLWGQRVCLLLDFEKPGLKRGTFFERMVDTIDALVAMGVEIATYRCVGERQTNQYSLVTEREVQQAYDRGETYVLLADGAIVTPLAADRARELNIRLG